MWYMYKYANDQALPDMIRACDWVIASFLDQNVLFPGDSQYTKVPHTMFSGVRGTTFINTYLNVAYMDLVRSNYVSALGYDPVLKSKHHGDDVFIILKSWTDAQMFNDIALKTGIEAKKEKLLTETGVGEYLRLFYYPNG